MSARLFRTLCGPEAPLYLRGLAIVLSYVALGQLSVLLPCSMTGHAAVIFAPAGIAAATAYLRGRSSLPFLFAGAFLLTLTIDLPARVSAPHGLVAAAVLYASAATLQAGLTGWMLRRFVGRESRLDRVRDVIAFLLLVLLGSLTGASLSVGTLALFGAVDAGAASTAWFAWWIADSVGVVALLPIVLSFCAEPRAQWAGRRAYLIAPILIVLGVFVSLFVAVRQREERLREEDFHVQADAVRDRIRARMEETELYLDGLVRFAAHDADERTPTRAEFYRFTQGVTRHFPMILALEWAPLVPLEQRARFEQAQRGDLPGFAIRDLDEGQNLVPAGRRPSYFPVTYIEPLVPNARAIGFDLASSPERVAAIEQALAGGRSAATAPIRLVQGSKEHDGMLLLQGVRARGRVAGLVLAVMSMGDFVDKATAFDRLALDVKLVDVRSGRLLSGRDSGPRRERSFVSDLSFGGRTLRFVADPVSPQSPEPPGSDTLVVLVATLAGTWLIGALALVGTGYTSRVQIQVAERTRALEGERDKSRAQLRSASDGVHILDEEGRVVEASDSFCSMLGYPLDQVIGMNVGEFAVDLPAEEARAAIRRRLGEPPAVFEARHERSDGRILEVEVSVRSLLLDGRPALYCSSRDIGARKQAEQKLRLAASVFANSHDGIIVTDDRTRIVEVNPAFTRITGYSREEALGHSPRMLASGRHGSGFYRDLWKSLREEGFWQGEIWNRRRDGETYPQILSISAVRGTGGAIENYIGVFEDITAVKRHEEEIDQVAHYDLLTGLPNRRRLDDQLARAIGASVQGGSLLAVCYLDLDGLRPVNERHGHAAGDALLVEIARRIQATLRGGDAVGRLGGDEFLIILPELARREECFHVLERVLAAVREPVQCGAERASITASIGVSLSPPEEPDAETLLRHADQAMYAAKDAGKNGYRVFDQERDRLVKAHRHQLLRLRQALDEHEFILHYQPKVDLVRGNVFGAEALIRWQHPEDGLLLPKEFLHYADGTDLEVAIGEWVIDSAIAQAARWMDEGIELVVSVNIGANHLLRPEFSERLQAALARVPRLPPGQLELEILENAALSDVNRAAQTLAACRALGVRVALDDFGTGYSSLAYFRRLPVDILKIDQSFVRNILDDEKDLDIVEGIVQLAQAFHYPVIAEGVETPEHGALVRLLGCRLAQGFGIARPMPAAELGPWVGRWKRGEIWAFTAQRPLRREDVALLTASRSHRRWAENLRNWAARDFAHAPPELDPRSCSFGHWYSGEGRVRYGALPEFLAIDETHLRVHEIAAQMASLAARGELAGARALLDVAFAERDRLLAQLDRLFQRVVRPGTPAVADPDDEDTESHVQAS